MMMDNGAIAHFISLLNLKNMLLSRLAIWGIGNIADNHHIPFGVNDMDTLLALYELLYLN